MIKKYKEYKGVIGDMAMLLIKKYIKDPICFTLN